MTSIEKEIEKSTGKKLPPIEVKEAPLQSTLQRQTLKAYNRWFTRSYRYEHNPVYTYELDAINAQRYGL